MHHLQITSQVSRQFQVCQVVLVCSF